MSGGSLDYLYYKVEDASRYIKDREIRALCVDFAKVLHDIEWNLDDDIGDDTLRRSIHDFKKKWFGSRDERLKEFIDDALHELKEELYNMVEVHE